MPFPRSARLFCVGLRDRTRGLPAGVRRRLMVVVVLLAAVVAVLLGVNPATVTGALAVPAAARELADLVAGEKPARRYCGVLDLQGR